MDNDKNSNNLPTPPDNSPASDKLPASMVGRTLKMRGNQFECSRDEDLGPPELPGRLFLMSASYTCATQMATIEVSITSGARLDGLAEATIELQNLVLSHQARCQFCREETLREFIGKGDYEFPDEDLPDEDLPDER